MTAERDAPTPKKPAETDAPGDKFEEALREVVGDDDETSCEDADASEFLERFPAAATQPQRPKTD